MVDQTEAENNKYCGQLVRRHDPDRWYALRYQAQSEQRDLTPLFALAIELRHVVYQVSTPPLGEIRLQWWRDALTEILEGKPVRAHPVVQGMAGFLTSKKTAYVEGEHENYAALNDHIELIINGRARLLYEAPFADVEDFFSWAKSTEGNVDVLGLRFLNIPSKTLNAEIIREGSALTLMARDGARLCPSIPEDELKRFISKKWTLLHPNFKALEPALMPLCLPYGMIRYYLNGIGQKSKSARLPTLHRHIQFFRSVLSGQLSK